LVEHHHGDVLRRVLFLLRSPWVLFNAFVNLFTHARAEL
jgi:hypothetical protein